MKDQPPKLAERLFKLFSRDFSSEDLLGDLYEVYIQNRKNYGKFWSKTLYCYEAIQLLFSYTIVKRKKEQSYSSHYQSDRFNIMISNYIKISFRNILKNKTFSLLNIFGLALGMSIGLLSLAFYFELHQFDRFHKDHENIYRVTTNLINDGNKEEFASAPTAVSYIAQDQLTGVEHSVHINDNFFPTVKTAGDDIRLRGYLTEPAFIDIFDFPIISGSKDVLNQPNTVIITYEVAQKLFGNSSPLGQKLETANWGILQVAGVLAPFPKNTHFAFDILAGFPSGHKLNESNTSNWTIINSNYFYLKSRLNPSQLETQLAHLGKAGSHFFEEKNLEVKYNLQSIKDINPSYHKMRDTIGYSYEWEGLFAFFGMSLLILVPACINYGNMAVANTLKRSKEIGIRKIMGSQNRQIIYQFLVETIIICLIAVIFSVFLFDLIRNELLRILVGGSALSMSLSPELILIFLGFAVFVGISTGLLPALYFARITPIKAIRKTLENQKATISDLRKGLLIFQFVLSLVFMIGIGVLIRQYYESLNHDHGFLKENVLVVPVKPENYQLVANTLSSSPSVLDISFTSSLPGVPLSKSEYFYGEYDSLSAKVLYVNEQFIQHLGIDMVWGDGSLIESQFEQVLVNETLMKQLNNLSAKTTTDSLVAETKGGKKVQIAGVIRDYNHEPLSQIIEAMVVKLNRSELKYALLSISTDDIVYTMKDLNKRWTEILPEAPFEASFLDNEIEKTYDFILTGIKIFAFLAILAVTISCLGLLGMVIFTTENRKKEMAIRKTLGAGQWKLLYTLSGLFFRMWVIALFIAIPASFLYYDKIMLRVYNKFSDGVGFSEVALSSILTLSLGLIAILIQSYRVIRTNPAESLRSE